MCTLQALDLAGGKLVPSLTGVFVDSHCSELLTQLPWIRVSGQIYSQWRFATFPFPYACIINLWLLHYCDSSPLQMALLTEPNMTQRQFWLGGNTMDPLCWQILGVQPTFNIALSLVSATKAIVWLSFTLSVALGEIQCFSRYLDHVLVSSSSHIKCFPLNRGWDTQQRIVQTLYLFKIFSFFCVCDPFVYPLSAWASNSNAVELVH